MSPAIIAVLLCYVAYCVNGPLSYSLGDLSITPTQIALLFGIFLGLAPTRKPRFDSWFDVVAVALLVLTAVTLAYAGIEAFVRSNWEIFASASVLINVLWALSVGRHFRGGMAERDWQNLSTGILVLGAIPLGAGLLEAILRRHLFTEGAMAKGLVDYFFVRGFSVDRIDFVGAILPPLFISMGRVFDEGKRRYWLLVALGMTLVLLSTSWTGIASVATGLVLLVATRWRSRYELMALAALTIIGLVIVRLYVGSQMGAAQIEAYEMKIERTFGDGDVGDVSDFRSAAWIANVEGFIENPLGIGFGRNAMYLQKELGLFKPISSHNVFCIPLEMGVPGFIALMMVLYAFFAPTVRLVLSERARASLPPGMSSLVIGLSTYVAFRFIAYFHTFDQTPYFILAALLSALPSETFKAINLSSSSRRVSVRRRLR
jgi:hypothetical protein